MDTLKVIKEPIHDYIAISELEDGLINDPLFLRLQHISQNGLAYLTYPSNRTSRFIHSLGTMYLGGEMILAALRASEKGERQRFLRSFKKVMEKAAFDVSVRLSQIKEFLSRQNDIFYRQAGLDPKNPQDTATIVLFQAVRIACVMHDLGHPPFSHSTETVLQSKLDSMELVEKGHHASKSKHRAYSSRGSAGSNAVPKEFVEFCRILSGLRKAEPGRLHEKIGRELTGHVFSEVSGEYAVFGRFCFWIANRIAMTETVLENPDGILSCLHAIVSEDSFDSDRCDYVLRDGYASSFEFGDYDLTRLLDNLRLHREPGKGFEMVSTTTASSALESFFLERYRTYRWIVFHPNVVRAELALSRALTILLEIAFANKPADKTEERLRKILNSWRFDVFWKSFQSPEHYRGYVSCDEPWLLALLREIQLKGKLTGWLPRRAAVLRVCLDFILDRRKSGFTTLWKRAEEYENFAKSATKGAQNFGEKLSFLKLDPSNSKPAEFLNDILQTVLERDLKWGEVECMRRLEDKVQEELRKEGLEGALLTKVCAFTPYKHCFVLDKKGKRISLSDLSTVVENLSGTWRKDIQFRAYWIGLQRKGKLFLADPRGRLPSRNMLAGFFLSSLMDEDEWYSLRMFAQAKELAHGKESGAGNH